MTAIMAASMSGLMSLIYSGGFSMDWLTHWPIQFLIAWPCAFILTMVAWPASGKLAEVVCRVNSTATPPNNVAAN